MNYLDLFSGIGGFALGAYWAGWRFDEHYFSEIDEYATRVYKKRFPEAIELGDIKEIDIDNLPKGEWVISGGFPCQPFSVAGQRRGKEDDRYLWPEMFRIIQEIKPMWAFGENVFNFINMGLDEAISDLESIGYEVPPPFVIPAVGLGAPHARYRVFFVAYSNSKNVQGGVKQQESLGEQIGAVAIPEAWKTRNGILPTSALCRTNDGVPYRVERTKCLGNSIVPQIAEILFRQIKCVM